MDKALMRIDKTMLSNSFRSVGVRPGITVMVHSSLNRLGFVQGGPDMIIDVLCDSVGAEGCVLMPAFSMQGSMQNFIESGNIFDVRTWPSYSGLLTETFRKRPDVLRSVHPTHSILAWGRGANELVQDHDKSQTPFGMKTPFGRIAEKEEAYVLMIGTSVRSLLHHLQERVDFPNLFLKGDRKVNLIDENGACKTMVTRVMRPIVPYYVAVPSTEGDEPIWVDITDFALLFPTDRDHEANKSGYSFDGYSPLASRRQKFMESGTFRMAVIGRAEIGLLHIKSFLNVIEPELKGLLKRFRSYYDVDKILGLGLPAHV